jgi:hypothetical protein
MSACPISPEGDLEVSHSILIVIVMSCIRERIMPMLKILCLNSLKYDFCESTDFCGVVCQLQCDFVMEPVIPECFTY